jgi:HD-GYP domain-containing protein (c-di-GMP phosphodiesterase class II)
MVRFSEIKNLSRQMTPQTEGRPSAPDKELPGVEFSSGPPNGEAVERHPYPAEAKGDSLYEDASFYLGKVFEAIRHRKKFALDPGFRIMRQFVESFSPEDPLFLAAIKIDDELNFLIQKSVNVSIYAIRLGADLGFSKEKQIEVGFAGLLHEVGMCLIPEKILYKKERLTEQEFNIIKQHSDYGFQILRAYGEKDPYLAEVALQVHERIDGSGYPKGLRGDEIHEYAQIVGLVDIYEALSHSRPQRGKFLHFYAIKEIIKTSKTKFYKKYLKALLNSFSIFPLSTYVRLNSNAVGRVIQTYPDQPMRPKLQIEYDSQGRKVLTERIVNLPENSLLYIIDSVSEEDLTDLGNTVGLYAYTEAAGDDDAGIGPEKFVPEAPDPGKEAPPDPPKVAGPSPKSGKFKWFKPMVILSILLVALVGFSWQTLQSKVQPAESGENTAKSFHRIVVPELPVAVRSTGRIDAPPAPAIVRKTALKKEPVTPVPEGPTGDAVKAPTVSGEAPKIHVAFTDSGQQDRQGFPLPKKTALSGNASEPLTGAGYERVISGPRHPYSILLSSFRSLKLAERGLRIYRESGIDPYLVKVDLGKDGIWYRVFTGHFEKWADAAAARAEYRIEKIRVKKTGYATLIGSFAASGRLTDEITSLRELGFDPYVIQTPSGESHLYVGAFYTRKGAEDQQTELLKKGVKGRIVYR